MNFSNMTLGSNKTQLNCKSKQVQDLENHLTDGWTKATNSTLLRDLMTMKTSTKCSKITQMLFLKSFKLSTLRGLQQMFLKWLFLKLLLRNLWLLDFTASSRLSISFGMCTLTLMLSCFHASILKCLQSWWKKLQSPSAWAKTAFSFPDYLQKFLRIRSCN